MRHYFSFDGRIGRMEYLLSCILSNAILVPLNIITRDNMTTLWAIISLMACVLDCWFIWAQGAKRCHDMGQSGWFQLIPFYFLWMFIAKGEEHSNQYGEPASRNDE